LLTAEISDIQDGKRKLDMEISEKVLRQNNCDERTDHLNANIENKMKDVRRRTRSTSPITKRALDNLEFLRERRDVREGLKQEDDSGLTSAEAIQKSRMAQWKQIETVRLQAMAENKKRTKMRENARAITHLVATSDMTIEIERLKEVALSSKMEIERLRSLIKETEAMEVTFDAGLEWNASQVTTIGGPALNLGGVLATIGLTQSSHLAHSSYCSIDTAPCHDHDIVRESVEKMLRVCGPIAIIDGPRGGGGQVPGHPPTPSAAPNTSLTNTV